MARKSIHSLLSEHRDARKILAELGALLGSSEEHSAPKRKEAIMIATKTVREIAKESSHATRVFEKLGIDYCCGGHKSLEEACASANLSIDEVVRQLEQKVDGNEVGEQRNWATAPIPELVDHIVNKHHAYVKSETPRLQALLAKVAKVHGTNHPELPRVQAAFAQLAGELASHLMKEEQILFPYLKLSTSEKGCGPSCFGSVQNPIRVMMMEHDGAGEKLREMRQVTNNYALPADACFSYGTLFSALQEFEKDLHQHIHLENNILFPRAIEMEGQH